METAEHITYCIEEQIRHNRFKNIFSEKGTKNFSFTGFTRTFIKSNRNELLESHRNGQSDEIITEITAKALKTFTDSNQFLYFNEFDEDALKQIYVRLWNEIIAGLTENNIDLDILEEKHLRRLSEWLAVTNPFSRVLNNPKLDKVTRVYSSEYSARFQLKVLGIDLNHLVEPILDIGCGEHANLVSYLQAMGFEAYGIDRSIAKDTDSLLKADWLRFTYKPGFWGTILANNSFSTHFIHHNKRTDGDYVTYAKTYMEILRSLKVNGTFHYAPSLRFIEELLPKEQYSIHKNSFGRNVTFTKICRII